MKPRPRNETYLSVLLLLVLLCVPKATADCSCNDTVCMYEAMKTELYTTSVADQLQLAFFTTIPFFDSVRISTTVNFTLTDDTLNTTSTRYAYWMHQWYPYTSYGVLRKLFPSVFRGSMDPWTALPVFYEFYTNQYFTPVSLSINLTCITSTNTSSASTASLASDYSIIVDPTATVHVMPTHRATDKVPVGTPVAFNDAGKGTSTSAILMRLNMLWAKNLQWAKAYGRYNGASPYPSDEDRGIAYDVTSYTPTDLLAFALFCTLYILFNIVVAIIVIATPSLVLKWLSTASQKKPYIFSLYISMVGFSAVYAILYLVGKIIIFTRRSVVLGLIRDDVVTKLFNIFAIVGFVVPWTFVLLHFFNALYTSKEATQLVFVAKQGVRKGVGKVNSIASFLGRHRRVAWTMSMWSVMTGVQLFAASAIPVLISLLTDSFRSLALFGIAITAMLCMIVVVAIVIHTCRFGDANSKRLLMAVIVLAAFGLLMTVTFAIYFLVLTNEGLDANSISVYVLSLVPTLMLAGVAYFSDNYLLMEDDTEESGEEDEAGTIDKKVGEKDDERSYKFSKEMELVTMNNSDKVQ